MAMRICASEIIIKTKDDAITRPVDMDHNALKEMILSAIESGVEFLEIQSADTLLIRVSEIVAIEIAGHTD